MEPVAEVYKPPIEWDADPQDAADRIEVFSPLSFPASPGRPTNAGKALCVRMDNETYEFSSDTHLRPYQIALWTSRREQH